MGSPGGGGGGDPGGDGVGSPGGGEDGVVGVCSPRVVGVQRVGGWWVVGPLGSRVVGWGVQGV